MTNDADNYPIPSSFKKLQIKVLNSSGGTVYVRNLSDVPIVDEKAHVTVTDLLPGMNVAIQAKHQDGVDG